METTELLRRAKETVPALRSFGAADLDRALLAMADALEAGADAGDQGAGAPSVI